MRTNSINCFTALLLLSFATGCCNPNKNSSAGPGAQQTLPTVTSVTPVGDNGAVCPNSAIISITFSKAMNPATINTSTFTVTGPSGASVAGQVTYASATDIATFTPSASLAPNTKFTATITTAATDTYGNTMEANFEWTFTTSASCIVAPAVTVISPANGTCPELAVVSAEFSQGDEPCDHQHFYIYFDRARLERAWLGQSRTSRRPRPLPSLPRLVLRRVQRLLPRLPLGRRIRWAILWRPKRRGPSLPLRRVRLLRLPCCS